MAYSVEQTSRSVLAVTMNVAAGWSQSFLLSSDRHNDNLHSDQSLQKRHLNQARERGAGVFDFGDLFCAMQGKWDKRADQNQLRDELRGNKYLDRLVDYNANFYRPYADLFVLIQPGNHEGAMEKHHQTSLTERLAQELKVPFGSYAGWVRFQFNINGTKRKTLWMYRHHGYGGGGAVTKGVIQTNRMAVYLPDANFVVSGHCFSADTEILTPTGWKRHDELVIGSPVATMNKATGAMEFQPTTAVHRHGGYAGLLGIKTDGVDLLVTPDHGLVYRRYRSGKIGECKASEFASLSEVELLCAAKCAEGQPDAAVDDDLLRFAVWVVADGHIERGAVRFHLKKQRKIARLTALLDRMGVKFSTSKASVTGSQKIRVSSADGRRLLLRLGIDEHDKCLPEWMYGLNGDQAAVVLDEYLNTDGTSNGGDGFVLYSAVRKNLDVLQALCVKTGQRSSLREGRSGADRLNITSRDSVFFKRGAATAVPHDGSTVWCVTVPNGTLVVRRNGCVTITQNTHDQWVFPIQRQRVSQGNVPYQDTQWHIKCGGYKDEFSQGEGWDVERGGVPKPKGAVWLRFFAAPGDLSESEISYELTPTA